MHEYDWPVSARDVEEQKDAALSKSGEGAFQLRIWEKFSYESFYEVNFEGPDVFGIFGSSDINEPGSVDFNEPGSGDFDEFGSGSFVELDSGVEVGEPSN
jgi:hypothetical protein